MDNSILLYFSIKTTNQNTLSVYCYKLNDTEISGPATSSEFLGGVYASTTFRNIGVVSSHRFSLLSPDPLVTFPRVTGTQTAVGFYSFGPFDTATPDHARWLYGFILRDIHGSPLNWSSPGTMSNAAGLDVFGLYNVDKLGSIQAVSSGNNHITAAYSIVYNATSDRDVRTTSNAVVISAMQIRAAYYNPGSNSLSFGSDPLVPQGNLDSVGHCRPQYTLLPDGFPKILSASFSFDQYLNIGYEYFPRNAIEPEKQKVLSLSYDDFPDVIVIPTYGKKRIRFVGMPYTTSNVVTASPNPQALQTVSQISEAWSLNTNSGFNTFSVMGDIGSLLLHIQEGGTRIGGPVTGVRFIDAEIEGITAPYVQIAGLGAGFPLYFGIVEMRD